jgi:hypothetical protein
MASHDVSTALMADVAGALNRCANVGLDIRAEYGALLTDAALVIQIDGRWTVRTRVFHDNSLVRTSRLEDTDE